VAVPRGLAGPVEDEAERTEEDRRGAVSLSVRRAAHQTACRSLVPSASWTRRATRSCRCTIWYVGDYIKKDATAYSSRIGAFRMPGCTGQP
jgi:hypothetical protein